MKIKQLEAIYVRYCLMYGEPDFEMFINKIKKKYKTTVINKKHIIKLK